MPLRRRPRPNVIVFLTDQQRWDTSGLHGNPLDLMPNFDRWARQGTHVVPSFTNQPVCGPARSCLQTGMYATTTGCFRNGIPLPSKVKTLAHYFRAGGYTTAYIGKWHLARRDPVTEPGRGGYEFWLASNLLEFTSDSYHTVVYDNDNRPVKLPGYRVDALTDAAIRYIDQHQKKRFLLFVSYLEPHHQNHLDDFPAPEGYRERYEKAWVPADLVALGGSTRQHIAGYYGMVKRLDEALGRLQDALNSLKLRDETILLFTSDHGCHFKTRNREYKRSCHESSIRVPTAFWGPGFDGGVQIQQLVSLVDLPPTLLEAAALPVPPTMQGRSIMPLVRSENVARPKEVLVQVSESHVGRALRTRRWKYAVAAPHKHGWLSAGSRRYVEKFLYDLEGDPHELDNLIESERHQAVARSLRQRLIQRMVAVGEAAPTITGYPDLPVDGARAVPQNQP